VGTRLDALRPFPSLKQMPTQVTATYADLYTWENLYLAYRKAAKGKRGRVAAAAFEYRLEDNLFQLQDELAAGLYRPGAYSSFTIHEPKRRLISAAPFRDRIVHHALCQLLEPAFEHSFIAHSYANRVGKGTHRAINTCQQWARRYPYVLQCDVRQFFPSIDHAILQRTLHRRIQDSGLRRLIKLILDSGSGVLSEEYEMVYFAGDDLFAISRPRGLPIGNLTSQFWANCYLNEFDHFVNRELGCSAYLRYVDDFLLFAPDKATLQGWRTAVIERQARLRLTLHEGRAQVYPTTHGIPFLGFVVYPHHRQLKRRKGIDYRMRLRRMLTAYQRKRIGRAAIDHSVRGWINHVRFADTWGLRRTILKEVRL
jgi:RNA-directed DNA polymerase